MKKRNFSIYFVLLAFAVSLMSLKACTDLSETIYSELNEENFYNNRVEVMQAVLRPFTHMQAWLAPTGQNGFYYHSEMSADQVAWPQKGRHGYDGGDHIRLHHHTWTPDENRLNNAWGLIWGGIGYINASLDDLEEVDFEAIGISEEERASILAEVKTLRAFHYMKAMDLWGNIPIVTTVGEPLNPHTSSRQDVFDFVLKELKENVPLLQALSKEMHRRVSQAAGYAMLAEL